MSNPFNTVAAKAYSDKVKAAESEAQSRQFQNTRNEPGLATLIELLYRYTGQGSLINQTELFFSRLDRYGINTLPGNVEHAGLTFFTRPKLPLTSGNLQQCPSLIGLDTTDPRTFAFAIRLWLDTKMSKSGAWLAKAYECPFFDPKSAINIPLSNACVAQSGWPDPFVQTFTTTGGFFQEDQTFAIGSDRLRKTYDLTFTFKETQGGPILAMLYAWYEVMSCLAEGTMVAYAEDIDEQRLCYTCSIYRFLLDPSKRHITHYAKATGCFPKAPPMGALFNQSRGELNVSAASEISIPFVVNKVEYDDPRILLDFNMLMTRYCPEIHTYPILRPESYNNFKGYPFAISTQFGLELAFRERNEAAFDDEVTHKKLVATTRERFELSELFYPDADITKLPRGPESRFLFRIAKTKDNKDTMYYLDRNDDYVKKTELDNDTSESPAKADVGFVGDTESPFRDVIMDKVPIQGYVDEKSRQLIPTYAPIFVNAGEKTGEIDVAALNAMLKKKNGVLPIVDASLTDSTLHATSMSMSEYLALMKKKRMENLAKPEPDKKAPKTADEKLEEKTKKAEEAGKNLNENQTQKDKDDLNSYNKSSGTLIGKAKDAIARLVK